MKLFFNIIYALTILFFIGIISLPFLNGRLHLTNEEKIRENRTKSIRPRFDLAHLDKYVKDYDSYYTDNFSLRENLIKYRNMLDYKLFGVSGSPNDVVIGKEGWFYEKKSAPNYKGVNLFSSIEMDRFRKELSTRTKWAQKRGIKYYLALVPNKMTVYPEYLPKQIIKASSKTRYDQIISLESDSVNIIDIRENLLAHKNQSHYLFQHTDDHWNELGAYYGYQSIMLRMNRDFAELKPISLNEYNIVTEKKSGNMAAMINAEEDYPEQFIRLVEKNKVYGHDGKKRGYQVPPSISDWDFEIVKVNENGKRLKCLFIRDSFTLLMIRFFQEHFKESVFIHDEWKYRMREDLIIKERPDIVINIVLETEINKIIEFPSGLSEKQEIEKSVYLTTSDDGYIYTKPDKQVFVDKKNKLDHEIFTFIKLENGQCAFLSHSNYFLSADLSQSGEIIANREKMDSWEKFEYIELPNGMIALKATNGKYLTMNETGKLSASSEFIGESERFKLTVLGTYFKKDQNNNDN